MPLLVSPSKEKPTPSISPVVGTDLLACGVFKSLSVEVEGVLYTMTPEPLDAVPTGKLRRWKTVDAAGRQFRGFRDEDGEQFSHVKDGRDERPS